MKEVACRVLDVLFRELERAGIGTDVLTRGVEVPLPALRDKHERIDWDVYRKIMANASRVWSDPDFERMGAAFFNTPYMRPVKLLVRLLFGASDFYKWAYSENGGGLQHFNVFHPSVLQIPGNKLELRMELREGYLPCREFFVVTRGALQAVPTLLALPRAEVSMDLHERGARYIVDLPQGGRLFPRLLQAIQRPFQSSAIAAELRDANDILSRRNAELEKARADLSRHAEDLRSVLALGQQLGTHRDAPALAAALSGLISGRVPCAGLGLWIQRGDNLELAGGVPLSDGAVLKVDLRTSNKFVGRLDLQLRKPDEEARAAAWLEHLAPFIAVALENLQYLEQQRAYQDELERHVQIRTQDLSQALAQLKEANRIRTEFFANASHELRTPLTLLLSPLESLVRDPGLPSAMREDLQSALRNAYRLLKLVNDLLDLSKLEAGKMRLRLGRTDLVKLLDETTRPWLPQLSQRGVTLKLVMPPSLDIIADGERLEQVALNLLSNAVRHVPDGGSIEVAASSSAPSSVQFSITNTGEGIPVEDLPDLFERFAQSTRSTARKFGSSGLGLPVVKEIVTLHKGTIHTESVPGQRVTFTVTLPAGYVSSADEVIPPTRRSHLETQQYLETVPNTPGPEETAPARTGKPLVLVVEDNLDLREFISRSILQEFDVISAPDGEVGLKLAREERPDLILSDMMMPIMDGLALCRAVKTDEALLGTPFVLLTARQDLHDRITGLDTGADDYLLKPFHPEELKARLRALLRVRVMSQKLSTSERLAALGTVVAGVSHEIRNPLNGIINSLLPLKELGQGLGESGEALIDIAIQCARRVEVLSTRLLNHGRVSSGLVPTELQPSIDFALHLVAHKTSGGPRLSFENTLESGAAWVLADGGALSQIWLNLLDNAIDAAGPEGRVSVTLGSNPQGYLVAVADTGTGIPPAVMRRIFDPFFTTKDVGRGTGLGLSIVQSIVRQHGGDIAVSSDSRGTTFTVSLPFMPDSRMSEHGASESHDTNV